MREITVPQLIDYLNDDDELVARAAEMLVKVEYSYENNELTYTEFQEIIEDILDLEKLGELSEHLERKQRVQQIFEVLRGLMGAITLL